MFNAHDLIIITHSRPRNFNRTYAQSANPRVGSRTFRDADKARAFVADVLAHGERVLSLRDGTSRRVTL